MNLALRHQPIPDSPLAQWDCRWKLAALFFAVGGTASLDHLAPAVAALALGLLLLTLSKLSAKWVRARLAVFALAALPFAIILPLTLEGPGWELFSLSISERGLISGSAVFCRGLAIGSFVLVLVGTAPLHHTFTAARRLRIPGVLVLLALLAYRYTFLLNDELRRLRVALWVRGFRTRLARHTYHTLGHVVGAVLVRGSDRAERVADAMRCRGFDGRFHTLAEFRTQPHDVVFFLLAILTASGLVVWDRLFIA